MCLLFDVYGLERAQFDVDHAYGWENALFCVRVGDLGEGQKESQERVGVQAGCCNRESALVLFQSHRRGELVFRDLLIQPGGLDGVVPGVEVQHYVVQYFVHHYGSLCSPTKVRRYQLTFISGGSPAKGPNGPKLRPSWAMSTRGAATLFRCVCRGSQRRG